MPGGQVAGKRISRPGFEDAHVPLGVILKRARICRSQHVYEWWGAGGGRPEAERRKSVIPN